MVLWQRNRTDVESRIRGVQDRGRASHQGLEPMPIGADADAEEVCVPWALTILAEVETRVDEAPRYTHVRRQSICQTHTEEGAEQNHWLERFDLRTHSWCAHLRPLCEWIGRLRPNLWAARYRQADIRLLERGWNANGGQAGIADCSLCSSITDQTYRMPAIVEADGNRHDRWPITTSSRANNGHERERVFLKCSGHIGDSQIRRTARGASYHSATA